MQREVDVTYNDSSPGVIVDTRTPATARIYDHLLGGGDNFQADRDVAEKIVALVPDVKDLAIANRQWAARVAKYCARLGVRQFVDVGTGFPTPPSVFDVVRAECRDAVVVGVDNDPVVLVHDRALLETDERVTFVQGDIRKPGDILYSLKGLIDFDRPVAVIMAALLHFVADSEDPAGIVASFINVLAPGSHVALSHATSTDVDPAVVDGLQEIYADASSPVVSRTEDQVIDLFADLEIADPGVVDVQSWHPERIPRRTSARMLAGVGRVPG